MTNIPRKTYAFSIMVAHQSTKKELVYANELYISTAFVLCIVCGLQYTAKLCFFKHSFLFTLMLNKKSFFDSALQFEQIQILNNKHKSVTWQIPH